MVHAFHQDQDAPPLWWQGLGMVHAVLAIALCHNVSPVDGAGAEAEAPPPPPPADSVVGDGGAAAGGGQEEGLVEAEGGDGGGSDEGEVPGEAPTTPQRGGGGGGSGGGGGGGGGHFQGASPDELALVQFAARCGLVLVRRTPQTIELREPGGGRRRYDVLDEMPFSAELKRMGILLRDCATGAIAFYVKGADTVMAERIRRSDWLEEEVGNLAREGLRTLVVACKALSQQQYDDFRGAMHAARLAKSGRAEAIGAVWDMLQEELTLLCVTAVEDKLQADVRATLERLRSANVRTWMLTGDKLEAAKVIAQNASLVSRHQPFHSLAAARTAAEARQALNGYP